MWLRTALIQLAAAGVALAAIGCAPTSDAAAVSQTTADVDGSPDLGATAPEATHRTPTGGAAASICRDELDDAVVFDRGAPTAQTAGNSRTFRIERVGLEVNSEDFTLWLSPGGEYDGRPPDDNRIELHLRSLHDPTRTGTIEIGFRPNGEPDAWDVRAGTAVRELADVEIVTSRIWSGQASGGGGEVTIPTQALPVQPPFDWYVTTQASDVPGVGDVCPNVTGSTSQRSLPTLPSG